MEKRVIQAYIDVITQTLHLITDYVRHEHADDYTRRILDRVSKVRNTLSDLRKALENKEN
jgi:hypothetical protein